VSRSACRRPACSLDRLASWAKKVGDPQASLIATSRALHRTIGGDGAVHQIGAMEDEEFAEQVVSVLFRAPPGVFGLHHPGRITAAAAGRQRLTRCSLHDEAAGRPWRCGRGRGRSAGWPIHSLTPVRSLGSKRGMRTSPIRRVDAELDGPAGGRQRHHRRRGKDSSEQLRSLFKKPWHDR